VKIHPFKLERYFAQHEFTVPYLFSSSDCEALTLQELLSLADAESFSLWEKLRLGYTESLGHPLLRAEIAKLYAHIKAEEVLVVAPEEGIFITMNVLLEAGDHVIATFPGYQSLYEVAQAIGCQVTRWLPEEKEGWKFDVDWLRHQIRENTRLIVVNFPHNPTGALPRRRDLAEIIRIASERGLYLFSDEMYRLLEYDVTDRLDSASDLYEYAISLAGMSKAFALAGLRIGWLTTRDEKLFQTLATFKDYTTICSSAPSEILAIMALRAKERIVARNLAIIRDNLALLDPFFARHTALFSWVKPKAGTIAFPQLLSGRAAEFCAGLREKQGVLLLPGDVYEDEGNHFRIGFGRRNMPQALSRLEEYVR